MKWLALVTLAGCATSDIDSETAAEAHALAPGDMDDDGVMDTVDNCVTVANSDQRDSSDYSGHADGFGDACDVDYTNDGTVAATDWAVFLTYFGDLCPFEVDPGGNGSLSATDFGIFLQYFGGSAGPAGAGDADQDGFAASHDCDDSDPLANAGLGSSCAPDTPGVWTSAAEIRAIPRTGFAWEAVVEGAYQDLTDPYISDQEDRTGLYCFAAAIVWTADPLTYPDRYDAAIECLDTLVARGNPEVLLDASGSARTLAWARNAFGYAATADLLDYRPPELLAYMENLADTWRCSQLDETLYTMATDRMPNNWGAHGLGSLAAIYTYLGNTSKLDALAAHLELALEGPNPYPEDHWDETEGPTWQSSPDDADTWLLITPLGHSRCGYDLGGIVPEDMQRGGPFTCQPYADWVQTNYPFETLQGLITAARVLERQGYDIWSLGDGAIGRAVTRYVQLADQSGNTAWAPWTNSVRGWTLPFVDDAYGTNLYEQGVQLGEEENMNASGRIAGWPFVIQ